MRISICHCLECQKRTGSVFAVQARFPRERVLIEGHAKEFVRVGDEGTRVTHRFCPECGSTVYYTLNGEPYDEPDLIAVPVGAFADPSFPPPRYVVYDERRHPWAVMPGLATEDLD